LPYNLVSLNPDETDQLIQLLHVPNIVEQRKLHNIYREFKFDGLTCGHAEFTWCGKFK